LQTRIIAALIAIPIVVIPIYLGGIWGLLLGVGVTILGTQELYNMFLVNSYHPAAAAIWVSLGGVALSFWLGPRTSPTLFDPDHRLADRTDDLASCAGSPSRPTVFWSSAFW
jgi:CDP-diglyceride synthetase